MGKSFAQLLCFLVLLGHSWNVSAEIVKISVHWENFSEGIVSPHAYGLNLYQAMDSRLEEIKGEDRYRSNLAKMNPGIVRLHRGNMMSSSMERGGWLEISTNGTVRWDEKRVTRAFGVLEFKPSVLINIPGWPASWNRSATDRRLDPKRYSDYARLCGELVHLVNVKQKRRVPYWEVINEMDEIYGVDCAELGRIVVNCGKAMKLVDPIIQVGGPGFARPDVRERVEAFLSTGTEIDFLSWHTMATGHATTPNSTLFDQASSLGGLVISMRKLVERQAPGRNIKMFHDEFNINWNPPDPRMNNITGAIYDSLVLVSLASAEVDASMAWNEADGWFGKLDSQWHPRPSAWIFEQFNREGFGRKVLAVSSDPARVVVFATRQGNLKKLVLINRSEADVTIQSLFNGWNANSRSATAILTVKRVTAQGIEETTVSLDQLNAGHTLPANTVSFLSIDRY